MNRNYFLTHSRPHTSLSQFSSVQFKHSVISPQQPQNKNNKSKKCLPVQMCSPGPGLRELVQRIKVLLQLSFGRSSFDLCVCWCDTSCCRLLKASASLLMSDSSRAPCPLYPCLTPPAMGNKVCALFANLDSTLDKAGYKYI